MNESETGARGSAEERPPFARFEVASRIVTLRDAINTLFREQYGGDLLDLLEERSILDLVRECRDEEEFAYRLGSITGLATAFDTDLLRANIRSDVRGT